MLIYAGDFGAATANAMTDLPAARIIELTSDATLPQSIASASVVVLVAPQTYHQQRMELCRWLREASRPFGHIELFASHLRIGPTDTHERACYGCLTTKTMRRSEPDATAWDAGAIPEGYAQAHVAMAAGFARQMFADLGTFVGRCVDYDFQFGVFRPVALLREDNCPICGQQSVSDHPEEN
ncbi:hypothetical protein J5X07_08055 [Actinomyces bowdenii]|uniref:Uncharacterized protein n=1 Tax=Actinomyces bowdenii TaxID=131109 RepID=A0A3P1V431_9ACTO|nr:hypothetical protein [Actinomyces bowdenii]MBO3724978.1 hypothetical protein [Actinomyces bowdenii]RRD28949.1 hypothetical protein EII10_08310 [Actinomyces bowdenii]